jgi:hypothetical protein
VTGYQTRDRSITVVQQIVDLLGEGSNPFGRAKIMCLWLSWSKRRVEVSDITVRFRGGTPK